MIESIYIMYRLYTMNVLFNLIIKCEIWWQKEIFIVTQS